MQAIGTVIPKGGKVAYVLGANDVAGITTFDPGYQNPRPAKPGDVLSINPDGGKEGRSADHIGAWELATQNGLVLVYQPVDNGPQYLIALV